MLHLNLAHGQVVRLPFDYEEMDGSVPRMLRHLAAHKRREYSGYSAVIYGKAKHCLSNDANGSDGRVLPECTMSRVAPTTVICG